MKPLPLLSGSRGAFSLSEQNQRGFDERIGVLVKIDGGDWKLIK
jgi:hypothetical protein